MIKVLDTYTNQTGTIDESEMSVRYQPVQAQTQSQPGILSRILSGAGNDINGLLNIPGNLIKETGSRINDIVSNPLGVLKQQYSPQNLLDQTTNTTVGPVMSVGNEYNQALGEPFKGGDVFGRAANRAVEHPVNTLMDILPFLAKTPKVPTEGEAVVSPLRQGLEKTGNSLIQSQYNLPRSAANSLKLNDTVGKLADYGITNINDVVPAAEKVTGANGYITKMTREAISKANLVDTKGLSDIAKNIAADPSIPPGQDAKLLAFFEKGLKPLGKEDLAGGFSQADPLQTYDYVQALEKKAAGISRGRAQYMIPEQDQALINAYRSFADELKNRLFVQSGADSQAINLVHDPAQLQELAKISPKLVEDITNAKTLGELRSIAAPFVKGSQAAGITESGKNLATNTMAGTAKGIGKIVQNPLNLLAMPLSSDTVNAGAGALLRGASKLGSVPTNASPVLNNLLKVGPVASAINPSAQTQNNSDQNVNQPNSQENTQDTQSQINHDQSITQNNQNSTFTKEKLAALIAAVPKMADTWQAIYNAQNYGKTGSPSSQEMTNQSNVKSGFNAIQKMKDEMKNNPSVLALAAIPGSPGARTFATARREAMDVIARLRTGAAMNKEEIKFYSSQVPQLGDSQQTIDYKLQNLENFYNSYMPK